VKKATKKKVIGEDEGKRAEAGVDKAMEKAVSGVHKLWGGVRRASNTSLFRRSRRWRPS
jgi:ribosome recycling factor